jgi:hypothetical protein
MSDPDKEQLLCDPNVCLIHRCRDSDTDGICDADELSLETDPTNHFDRPDFRDVLRKLGDRELPSFQEGQSMVIVLPTVGPDGQAVFGGEAMLPARHDLLKQIGVELPAGGPDLTDGLMLVRSLESANVVEFHRPPWTEIQPPSADTTRDSGTAESTMGAALQGMFVDNFKFQSMSSNEGYRFSTFTFSDGYGRQWTGSSQTGPTSSSTKVETHEKNNLDSYEFDKVVNVNTTVSDGGNTTTTITTMTHYVSPDGKQKSTHTYKKTKYTSSDGTEHVVQTEKDGVVQETQWWHDGFEKGEQEPDSAPGDFPEPTPEETGAAHSDPDYIEYTASPEAIEAALVMRAGPVRIVDPLSGEGEETFIPGIETNSIGPISLFAPDAAGTSITDPMFIHMPFDGDYDPNGQEAPTSEKMTQNGKCIYCNQDGD